MNRKIKGINGEREIIHLFHKYGWNAIRVAGSGSSRYPSPDILAGNGSRIIALECKIIKSKTIYIQKTDIEQLNIFAQGFGAEPWTGIKFQKDQWYFLPLHDLEQSQLSYVINHLFAKQKGFVFEELIQKNDIRL